MEKNGSYRYIGMSEVHCTTGTEVWSEVLSSEGEFHGVSQHPGELTTVVGVKFVVVGVKVVVVGVKFVVVGIKFVGVPFTAFMRNNKTYIILLSEINLLYTAPFIQISLLCVCVCSNTSCSDCEVM